MEKGDIGKASALMMTAVFAGFLLFFAVGFITMPFQGVNYTEQRLYAPKPKCSFESVINGEFEQGMEDYLSDHIILREELITLKHDLSSVFGRTLPKIAYKGKDGQYFLRYREYTQGMEATISAFRSLAREQKVPVDMLLVPDATVMLPELLPGCAVNDDQQASAEKIISALKDDVNIYYAYDRLKELKAQGMQLYYKTDQHWTTDCAKDIFEWYMRQSGQQLKEISYTKQETPDFYGNLYTASPSFFSEPDKVAYYAADGGEYELEWLGEDRHSDSLFDNSWIMGIRNRYNIFFGGSFHNLRIRSNAPKGRILVLADSYAMPVVTFLADQYSDVAVIDLRNFDKNKNTVKELLGDFEPERILFVNTVYQISCGSLKDVG